MMGTARKYGDDKVAQIITFGTLGAKAAIRDVGRVMDIPSTGRPGQQVDRAFRVKAIDRRRAQQWRLQAALTKCPTCTT